MEHHRSAAAMLRARARGWTTLLELLALAAASPVDLEAAAERLREAGVEPTPGELDWPEVGRLAGRATLEPAPAPRGRPPRQEESTGALDLYLTEVRRGRLLTADEEVALARRIEEGAHATARLRRGAPMAKRRPLEQLVRRGEAARQRMIESNLRLVVAVARRYRERGVPLLDLIQEGSIGLSRAVDKFDWRRGFRFSTYAYWWIRQAIARAISEQSRTIRLPILVVQALARAYDAERALAGEIGRPPTTGELAGRLGLDVHQVEELFRLGRVPISLDAPVGDAGDATMAELVADAAPSLAAVESRDADRSLAQLLAEHLPPRQARVLRLRHGLDRGGEPRTLREVGRLVGVSRERVRQLEEDALATLRRAEPVRAHLRELTG